MRFRGGRADPCAGSLQVDHAEPSKVVKRSGVGHLRAGQLNGLQRGRIDALWARRGKTNGRRDAGVRQTSARQNATDRFAAPLPPPRLTRPSLAGKLVALSLTMSPGFAPRAARNVVDVDTRLPSSAAL